jgi:hypothetical protein
MHGKKIFMVGLRCRAAAFFTSAFISSSLQLIQKNSKIFKTYERNLYRHVGSFHVH